MVVRGYRWLQVDTGNYVWFQVVWVVMGGYKWLQLVKGGNRRLRVVEGD